MPAARSTPAAPLLPMGAAQRELLRRLAPEGFPTLLERYRALATQVGRVLYALAESYASAGACLTDVDVTPEPAGASPGRYALQLYVRLGGKPWARVDSTWTWQRAGGGVEALHVRDLRWDAFARALVEDVAARFREGAGLRQREVRPHGR